MGKEKNKFVNRINAFLSKLKDKVSLDGAILFGSRARGDARENSDFDIILISKDFAGKKYFQRPAGFYLLWEYPQEIDIICLTPEEYEIKKKQLTIIRKAAEEGIKLI
ncbi:MAG: nucleotidyltransferase domain-containing protein [Nanoarchaeota archaeon]